MINKKGKQTEKTDISIRKDDLIFLLPLRPLNEGLVGPKGGEGQARRVTSEGRCELENRRHVCAVMTSFDW